MSEGTRLNKYLSEAGFCSRRKADEFIERKKVTINGEVATVGTKVFKGDEVKVGEKLIKQQNDLILLAFNKPRGITCTAHRGDKSNVMDYINYKTRLQYIGRLDKDSEGLMLFTNNGEITNAITKSKNEHEKEYIVTVGRDITAEFLENMSKGVKITDKDLDQSWVTKPCKVRKIGNKTFGIILTQGLKRQIRRMCEKLGYRVTSLKRVRVMNIELGDLPVGEYRDLTREEVASLMKLIKDDMKK